MHPVLFRMGALLVPSYGVLAALGILLALGVAQPIARRTLGRQNGPRHAWNMLVLAVFASLVTSRLLLVAMNLSDLRSHPAWLLSVAMVHHPLLSAAEAASALVAVLWYARWAKLPLAAVADCLAAPVALGLAAEQAGALLAGSDFGREVVSTGWAVIYQSPLAARWSGTPLGVPLYPVQAYAAIGALLLALLCLAAVYFAHRQFKPRPGDVAGLWLVGAGSLLFTTEMYRDWEGRGVLFGGRMDIPQLVGLGMVLAAGAALWQRHPAALSSNRLPERGMHV